MANPEIREGPTPSGGVRSELYILDGGKVIIRELAKDGSLISETFGSIREETIVKRKP
jgi:hypothetical protein